MAKGKKGKKGQSEGGGDEIPLPDGVEKPYDKANDKAFQLVTNAVLGNMVNGLEETKLNLMINVKGLKEELTLQKQDQSDVYVC